MKFSAAFETICDHLEAGVTDFLRGSPGIGKTALAFEVAEEFNLEPIVLYFASKLPEEVNGAPEPYDIYDSKGEFVKRSLRYLQFDNIPTEDWELPKGKDGWLLILDEVTSTPENTQPTLFSIVQEKTFGDSKLHPDCSLILLGNLMDDRGVVFEMPTPLISKVAHVMMEPDVEGWLKLAYKHEYPSVLTRFISAKPSMINNFNPNALNDTDNPTFSCQRTLSMLAKVLGERSVSFKNIEEVQGVIGKEAAVDFISFCELADKVPSKADILSNPNLMPVEEERQLYMATLVGEWLTKSNSDFEINQLCSAINNMKMSMKVLTFRNHLRYADSIDAPLTMHHSINAYNILFEEVSEALVS